MRRDPAQEETSTTLRSLTGASGVLWCALSLLALATLTTTDLSEPAMEAGDVHAIMTAMADNPGGSVTALYLFLASIVCAAGFGTGMAQLMAGRHPSLHLARAAVVIGTAVFLIETMVSISLAQAASTAYAAAAPAEQELLRTPIHALMQFRNNGAYLGSTLLAVAALLFGAAALRRPEPFPRWTAYIVTASGLLGIAGSLTPFFPAFSSIRQMGLTAFSVWALVVGFLLLRGAREPEGSTAG